MYSTPRSYAHLIYIGSTHACYGMVNIQIVALLKASISLIHTSTSHYRCLIVISSLRHLLKIYINFERYTFCLWNPLADCYSCMCLNCMDIRGNLKGFYRFKLMVHIYSSFYYAIARGVNIRYVSVLKTEIPKYSFSIEL